MSNFDWLEDLTIEELESFRFGDEPDIIEAEFEAQPNWIDMISLASATVAGEAEAVEDVEVMEDLGFINTPDALQESLADETAPLQFANLAELCYITGEEVSSQISDSSASFCWKGTTDTGDLFMDIDVRPAPLPNSELTGHSGFINRYMENREKVMSDVATILETQPDIYLAGHSAGVIAYIHAWDILKTYGASVNLHIYTYGAPNVFSAEASEEWKRMVDEYGVDEKRYINIDDPVPFMSPYSSAGKAYVIDVDAGGVVSIDVIERPERREVGVLENIGNFISQYVSGATNDHSLEQYIRYIKHHEDGSKADKSWDRWIAEKIFNYFIKPAAPIASRMFSGWLWKKTKDFYLGFKKMEA